MSDNSKKNKTSDYIFNTFDRIMRYKEIVASFTALALWVLGIWFAYSIRPVVENIENLDSRVYAVEEQAKSSRNDQTRISNDVTILRDNIWLICGKLGVNCK